MHTVFHAMVALSLLMMSEIWSTANTAPAMIEKPDKDRVINLLWSADVSSLYPPRSPLKVLLGNKLNVTCPANATSNIWIQNHLEQYDKCNCNATSVENPSCTPNITTRQICQDEVMISITLDSQRIRSALSFEPDTTYYLISYSQGDQPLAGYKDHNSGGECLKGFRMALQVLPSESSGTASPGDDTSDPKSLVIPSSESEGSTYNGTPLVSEASSKFSKPPNRGSLMTSGALLVLDLTKLISVISVSLFSLLILL